jgi:hypothetical protein
MPTYLSKELEKLTVKELLELKPLTLYLLLCPEAIVKCPKTPNQKVTEPKQEK